MRTFLCALFVAAAIAQPALAQDRQGALSAAQDLDTYVQAVEAFRDHRYSAAYGRFMRLADAGHEASAQMALMMYRNGPSLFAAEWEATDVQLAKWSALVVAAERESSDFLRVSTR